MEIRNISCIVFSPTGGCLRMVRSVKSVLWNYEVVIHNITRPLVRKYLTEIIDADYLIFGYPVYADSMPDIFANFLEELRITGKPVTLIAGFGNINIGKALYNAKRALEDKGNVVCSACAVVTAHSYNGKELKIAENEPTFENLRILNQFILKSIDKIKDSGSLESCRINLPEGKIRLQCKAPQKFFPQILIKKPLPIRELCDLCMACKNACPAGAINDLLDIDENKCIRCLACIKFCNKNARVLRTRTSILINTLQKESKSLKENVFYI